MKDSIRNYIKENIMTDYAIVFSSLEQASKFEKDFKKEVVYWLQDGGFGSYDGFDEYIKDTKQFLCFDEKEKFYDTAQVVAETILFVNTDHEKFETETFYKLFEGYEYSQIIQIDEARLIELLK